MSIDALKPAPAMETVRFETNPPGAEAKAPNGQSCHTPCALALPTNAPMTISFALNGYLPRTESIEPVPANIGLPELRPNPVQVDLSPAPPPKKKPTKKPATRTSGKTAPKPAPANTAAPAPAAVPASQATPQPPSPAMQPAPSPWPATPPPTGQ